MVEHLRYTYLVRDRVPHMLHLLQLHGQLLRVSEVELAADLPTGASAAYRSSVN